MKNRGVFSQIAFIVLLAVCSVQYAYAQTYVEKKIKFCFKDESYAEFKADDVDSITTVDQGGGAFIQQVWVKGKASTINTLDVDSVSYFTDEYEGVKFLDAAVVTDLDEMTTLVCDTAKGEFAVQYANEVPTISSGNVVVIPYEGKSQVVLVKSAERNGNVVSMEGKVADLRFVFNGTSFTLSPDMQTSKKRIKSSRKKIRVSGGTLPELDEKDYFPLWDINTEELFGGKKKYKIDDCLDVKAALNTKLNAIVRMNFSDEKEKISLWGMEFEYSKDMDVAFGLDGDIGLSTNIDVHAEIKKEFVSKADKVILLAQNFVPPIIHTYYIPTELGAIPVEVTYGVDLYAENDLVLKGKLSMSYDANFSANASLWASYSNKNGLAGSAGAGFPIELDNLKINGQATLTHTASIYPFFYAWVYNTAGPGIGIKPVVETKVGGSYSLVDFDEEGASDALSSSFSVEFTPGLELGVTTVAEYLNVNYNGGWSPADWGITGKLLKPIVTDALKVKVLESPTGLELVSSTKEKVVVGEPNTLKFKVLATFKWLKEDIFEKGIFDILEDKNFKTFVPSIIMITVPNENISTFILADLGNAQYTWTPKFQNSILYATIYDLGGSVKGQVQFGDGSYATLEVEPSELLFGEVAVGSSSTKTFSIKNTGANAVSFSLKDVPPFYTSLNNENYLIDPGETLSVNVTYKPDQLMQSDYAELTLKSSSLASDIIIKATGVPCEPEQPQTGTHEYVDLGLPSGTLWATCNVGANSPEEYGYYFAWGETKPKSNYSWSTYFDTTDGGKTFGKYNYDGKKTLDPEDDAAFTNWGENWRMPTGNEFEELRTECTWTWNSSKKGYDVVGPNKKAIFIPATGHILNGSGNSVGQTGNYWVSSLDDGKSNLSVDFHFSSSAVDWNYDDRYHGHSIRPVYNKKQEPQTGSHEYVDLGLSVKWATCNVGANSPEEYGDYFAWGETKPKDVYNWSTYTLCNGSSTTMTKYCTSSSYGTVDNRTTLELADDAAYKNWGGSWRMPTKAEQDELQEKCTWTWTTQNGVYGRKVVGPNGNSIFLPAAGYRYEGSLLNVGPYRLLLVVVALRVLLGRRVLPRLLFGQC